VTDFAQALSLEPDRIAQNWSPTYRYADVGRYVGQLTRYFRAFDRQRIPVLLYEDLTADLEGACRGIFEFLEVDGSFRPDLSKRLNQSGLPQPGRAAPLAVSASGEDAHSGGHEAATTHSRSAVNLKPPPAMAPRARAMLTHQFREEILRLQDFIDRDLTGWLATSWRAHN
jgi:hypothetical protein